MAVLGDAGEENYEAMMKIVRRDYRPNVVVAASPYPVEKDAPALLRDRPLVNGRATAYVCEGFVCKQPVTDAGLLEKSL